MDEHVTICEVGPRDGLQMAHETMPTRGQNALDRGLRRRRRAGDRGRQLRAGQASCRRWPTPRRSFVAPSRCLTLSWWRWRRTCAAPRTPTPPARTGSASRSRSARGTAAPTSTARPPSRSPRWRGMVAWLRDQPRRVAAGSSLFDRVRLLDRRRCGAASVLAVAAGLVAAGVETLALADTVGYAQSRPVRSLVRAVRGELAGDLERLHLHDTMGLGLANALAGLEEGVRKFDCRAGRAGRLPVRPRRIGQHRHRGPGVHAGEHGIRHRHRPAPAADRARNPCGRTPR